MVTQHGRQEASAAQKTEFIFAVILDTRQETLSSEGVSCLACMDVKSNFSAMFQLLEYTWLSDIFGLSAKFCTYLVA